MVNAAQAISLPGPFAQPYWKRPTIWRWALLGGLLSWLYLPVLFRLAQQWWTDPNFSHGFFVSLFSTFVLWRDRHRIASVEQKPSIWGLPVVIVALCALILGTLGAEVFLARTSLLLLAAGMVVFFCGWQMLRTVLFPLAFLLLMVPIPAIIFNQITFPLQIFASKVAAWALPFFGVPVLREGNVINLPAMPLEVADACSGIRSLLSLASLAIMYGYLLEKSNLVRVLLAFASVPIAVAANGFRIVGTGLLVQYWDPDKAEGFFHEFQGWLVFVSSLLMLFLFHKVLKAFFRRPGAVV
jgi:exosortase